MVSGKAWLGSMFGRFMFREARVAEVTDLSPRFRRLVLTGGALRDTSWTPGDKLQLFLPGTGMRTYTPMTWDAERGVTELLVYVHGESPGVSWGRKVVAGDSCQLFGPRRSIDAGAIEGDCVLFGDETSFAVAYALRRARRGPLACLFEVSRPGESAEVLRALGLEGAETVGRMADDAHVPVLFDHLRAMLRGRATAQLVMTGKAQSIQALRARLRAEGLSRSGKVKAYWSEGNTGLD
jgi:NADPH-dependent ferric siderophore reductase